MNERPSIKTRLEARGLTRAFGEHYALIELNAEWRAGEICALLGPNGAGKSTLLNLLSTLMLPSEGEIILDGDVLSRVSCFNGTLCLPLSSEDDMIPLKTI